ncbi:hypothetical protein SOASR030_07170 [Leminorella grimontii]|uniref:NAD(P)-binding domain-containing protein n=1 Tax=Leminorella grimontii TaxID=82981 RepID=A0AAV5MZ65_9GAMM|nr:NAD(P)H-binding protein [Leminorella grimontii]KFC96206.1 flavin reductase [Leminorella grimontii ATCC 33999 = DSM 5078]GKX54605.1 hypothetical protein SOASR030_07170 [Leminorella grimontii]VFS58834.1 Putative NADH-flavin reductase [Leminorella grimontii]
MSVWLIFGAAKGTGAHVLEYALAHQRQVFALLRREEDAARLRERGVIALVGDATDAAAVERICTMAGADCTIVSTMGGSHDYLAHRTVIDAAEKAGIKDMVMVTSLGCGDSWPTLSDRAKAAFGQAVREKSLAEVWLQTSGLNYGILRPGGLLNGEATGKAQCYQHQEVHGFVNRSDVALTIANLIGSGLSGQVYSLIEPGLAPVR